MINVLETNTVIVLYLDQCQSEFYYLYKHYPVKTNYSNKIYFPIMIFFHHCDSGKMGYSNYLCGLYGIGGSPLKK